MIIWINPDPALGKALNDWHRVIIVQWLHYIKPAGNLMKRSIP